MKSNVIKEQQLYISKKNKPSAIAGNPSKQEVRRGRTGSVQGQPELPAKLLRAKLDKTEPK